MLELITKEEKQMIDWARARWGYDDSYISYNANYAEVEKFLNYWENNKKTLFKLFGNKLILEYPLDLVRPSYETEKIVDDMKRNRDKMPIFLVKFNRWVESISEDISYNDYLTLRCLYSTEVICNKKFEGSNVNINIKDKNIKYTTGTKYVKVMKIVNSAVGFATEEEYEAFRIWHSMLFNSAKMTGNLCLSIHPLDYITMSENDEGWSSCMNWHDEGCYRRGTIEMMNSKYVLVAYVKSENNEIYMGNDNHWNSKKWRSLFYLDKDIITSIKGYPYQHPALVKVIIEKLEELAEANLGYMYGHKLRKSDGEDSYLMWDEEAVNYWYTDKYFHFVTNAMYNDFGCTEHYFKVNENTPNLENDKNYSGPCSCVYCGEDNFEDYDEESCREIVCPSCAEYKICDCCGGHMTSNDDVYYVDGMEICHCCWEDRCVYTPIDGEYHYDDEISEIYLATRDENGEVLLSPYKMKMYSYDEHHYLRQYFGKDEVDGRNNSHWFTRRYVFIEDAIKDIDDFFEESLTKTSYFREGFFISNLREL